MILFILCGEAFSGKSTVAEALSKQYDANVAGRDEVYFQLEKIMPMESTSDEEDTALWENLWPIALHTAKNFLRSGDSVVFDDTVLLRRQRDELGQIAKDVGAKSVLIYLDTPTELIQKRREENKITKHRHEVLSSWIQEDRKIFERPTSGENPIVFRPTSSLEELFRQISSLI